jgi:hypothetical protein
MVERSRSSVDLIDDGDSATSSAPEQPLAETPVTGSSPATTSGLLRLLPWVLVVAVGFVSLVNNGVAPGEIARFAAYWSVAVVAPGFVVIRSIADRSSLEENLIGAAALGLGLELAAWSLFRALGVDALVIWWWLPVLAIFAAVPALRTTWLRRHRSALAVWWNWSLAAVCLLAVVAIDVGGFRANPLPPSNGVVYVDLWWHLAMVQELMRDAPAQVPQVAGEALNYHLHAHAHMAVASATARVEPEVVLFRLWILPIVVVTIGLVAMLARRVSAALWAGPVAAWLTVGVMAGGFIWPGRLGEVAGSPIVFASPSQLIANVFMVAGLWLLVDIVRGRSGRWHVVLFGLLAWAGIGSKPTVGALLLAGVVAAAAASVVVRRARPNRATIVAGAGLLGLLGFSLATQNSEASRFTVLGSLRGNRVYDELNPHSGLRAVNDGLLLDSIDDGRALVAVVFALIVLLGFESVRLIGLGVLARQRTRRDLAGWLLAGAVVAGWGAFFVLDHVGYSQAYFLITAVPAGAALTAWLLVDAVGARPAREAVPVIAAGLGIGVVTSLVAIGAAEQVLALPGGGMLDLVATPLVVVAAVAAVSAFLWRRLRSSGLVGPLGLALAISIVIGIASAPAVSTIAGRLVRFGSTPGAAAVDTAAAGFVTAGELHAARWLRDNSAEDDVIATNLHCRPPTNEPIYCDARGYWLSGQSGRRIVLEGWSYTSEAQAMHGEGGRSFALQPAPWPERYELSQAAVVSPTAEVLERLSSEFGVSWVVAVRRADAVSPRLGELADLAFDNGEVAIYRLR